MDFNEKKADTVKARKPPSVSRREPSRFDANTINQQDYQAFEGVRQRTSYRPVSSRYLTDVPFNAVTEHRSNFDGKAGSVQRVTRPVTQYHPSSEPLDGNTTYKLGYTSKKAAPTQSMRPVVERVPPSQAFESHTTHRSDFIERQVVREKLCPAEVVLNRKNNKYQHVGQRDGHRFYKRVGLSSGSNRELTPITG